MAELMLLDAAFKPVARGFGSLQQKVPPGLYVARALYGACVQERALAARALDAEPVTFESSLIDTPLPLRRSTSYDARHAAAVTAATADAPAFPAAASSFLLCLRRLPGSPAEADPGEQGFAGFSLLRPNGQTVVAFNFAAQLDLRAGLRVARVELPPGDYYLMYEAKDFHRVLPVVLVPTWRFECYLQIGADGPDFPNGSVYYAPARCPFDADDGGRVLAELIRGALMRRASLGWGQGVPTALVQRVSAQYPFTAVLAAHLLLSAVPESRGTSAFCDVMKSAEMLGPSHPDCWVLKTKCDLLEQRAPDGAREFPAAVPPLLLQSWGYLLDVADKWPASVNPAFVASTASILCQKSLWTSLASTGAYPELPEVFDEEPRLSSPTFDEAFLNVPVKELSHADGAFAIQALEPAQSSGATHAELPGLRISPTWASASSASAAQVPAPTYDAVRDRLQALLSSRAGLEAQKDVLPAKVFDVLKITQQALRLHASNETQPVGEALDDSKVKQVARSLGVSVGVLGALLADDAGAPTLTVAPSMQMPE